jgi:hypothetical protein
MPFKKNIQNSKKKTIRIIGRVPPRTPCKHFFQKFSILTFYDHYILEISSWVKDSLSSFMAQPILDYYGTKSECTLLNLHYYVVIQIAAKID